MYNHTNLTLWERIRILLFHLLPHHLISQLTFYAARWKTPWKDPIVRAYIRFFDVDLTDAEEASLHNYPSFDDFFTRRLKSETRPICDNLKAFASPCDGRLIESGDITADSSLEVKGHSYTIASLFGGMQQYAADFQSGKFCSIYLSPRDYHRVHMPADGQLEAMIHIPGRLYSVAPYALQAIPLYAMNERVVSIFTTPLGRIAVIMVGAINVGSIETVWHGLVTPTNHRISCLNHTQNHRVYLRRGEEMGCFHLGSSVILLSDNPSMRWNPTYSADSPVRMGEELACAI